MPWRVVSAIQKGSVAEITLEIPRPQPGDPDAVERRVLKHYRSSFGGTVQTLAQWRANIKREVAARLRELNDAEDGEPETDILSAVR